MVMEIIFLIIIVFVVQYFIMSWVTTNSRTDITHNLNKIYLSTISGLGVAFLFLLLNDFKSTTLSANYYIGLGVGFGLLAYAYRNQLGVTNYDWVNTMIEKQSEGILVSKFIDNLNLQSAQNTQINIQDFAVSKLANWIVKNQLEEIGILKNLSSQMVLKDVFY